MNKPKNDFYWEQLFKKHKIIDQINKDGFFEISASQINQYREARLMTKFDHKSQLPKPFSENKLSILPITRGKYYIGNFQTFCNFNTDETKVSKIEFPTFLESLDYKNITSEATAINCSFISNILSDFTNEEILFPTVSGRMSSSSFKFKIDTLNGFFNFNVKNSQVEIDGGFEGSNSLILIEAKNYISDDFLVRQLFYPYKLWSNKVNKHVRPIFLTYTNGIFHLREYIFHDINYYNSLELVSHKKYVIKDGSFNIEVLTNIINESRTLREPDIPFPQANSFERVINLCELLIPRGFISKEYITQNYDFDYRQTDYYVNAGKYLGLIKTGKDPISRQNGCFLTKKGKYLFTLDHIERQIEFVKLIVSHTAFKKTLKLYLNIGEMPSTISIVEIMKHSKLYNINSNSTYHRRASTIIGWVNWIIGQIEE